MPSWLSLETNRVIGKFMSALVRRARWRTLYIVSPWISEFDRDAGLSFLQFIRRLRDEDVATYVVTRPPVDQQHSNAVSRLKDSGVASIAYVDALHTKLYCARTETGSVAMLGSANLTQRSLSNVEIGMIVTDYGEGRRVVQVLLESANALYRTPGRTIVCKRRFGGMYE